MVRHTLTWSVAAVAAVAAMGTSTAHAASSSAVTCGETLTHSVKLTANLTCLYNNPALTVGAAGIDINLNGHQVSSGTSTTTPSIVDDGFSSLTIRNGTVFPLFFADGIGISDADDVHIVDVTATSAAYALLISGGTGNVVKHSSLGGNDGVLVGGSDGVQFVDDTITGDSNQTDVLALDDVNHAKVINSALNGPAPVTVLGDDDLVADDVLPSGNLVVSGGSHDTLEDNQIEAGLITVDAAAAGTRVSSNDVTPFGIAVLGTGARIVDNAVSGLNGINVSGSKARIVGNTASNTNGDGIQVSGGAARIADNTANSNPDDGIDVSGARAQIIGNTANANRENGIAVSDPSATITGNIADDNIRFGITATLGDSGDSNTATGNNSGGDQCLNISCSATS